MNDNDDNGVFGLDSDEEFPGLETEEDRDKWIEILMGQDDETLEANGSGWCKAITVRDEMDNMVVRFVYPDGTQEVFDFSVRRSFEIPTPGGGESN